MTNYDSLRSEAMGILKKYGMDKFVAPYSVDLINFSLRKQTDKLREMKTREACMGYVGVAVAKMMGCPVSIDKWISSQEDQTNLFVIFSQWREKLLKEI